jgi:hypothetical protein
MVPCAANVVGTVAVTRAAPDGYTLLFATSAGLVTNPYTFKTLAYDPLRDLSPVSMVARSNHVLAVTPSVMEPVAVTACGTPAPVIVRPVATAVAVTEVASVVETLKTTSSASPPRVTSWGYDASPAALTVRTGASFAEPTDDAPGARASATSATAVAGAAASLVRVFTVGL